MVQCIYRFIAAMSILAGILLSAGCGNLSPRDNVSPRLEQKIDNQNGKIDRIESNQNAIKLAMDRYNLNNGIQILQGDGGLLLVAGIVGILGVTVYYYRSTAHNEKIVDLLIEQIKSHEDAELEEKVLKAAMYTDVEKDVYYKISRNG